MASWLDYDHILDEFKFRMSVLGFTYHDVTEGWSNIFRCLALAIYGDEGRWEGFQEKVTTQLAGERGWAYNADGTLNTTLSSLLVGGTLRQRLILGAASAEFQVNVVAYSDHGEGIFPVNGIFNDTIFIAFIGGHFGVLAQVPQKKFKKIQKDHFINVCIQNNQLHTCDFLNFA